MGKNVFIVNGHQKWDMSPGRLNRTLVERADDVLSAKGYEVRLTHIDDDWVVGAEIDNMVWADFVIFQFPVYWFGVPWGLKKYLDEVYMFGRGKIFLDDGRTRKDPSRKYGTGGLLQGRSYMVSTTWNAPEVAMSDPEQLFEGKGVDGVFLGFHKVQEFVGMTKLPSFTCYDVLKNPDIEDDFERWGAHLEANF